MTNEQRAHDLAIAYVNQAMNPVALMAAANAAGAKDKFCFDVFREYMKVYNSVLGSFERHFPSEE